MSSVIDRYRQEVRENREIEYNGLKLYPLTMRDYESWADAKPIYELLLSSLPAKLARHSWCACLWEMDKAMTEQGQPPMYFQTAMLIVAKALRLQSFCDGKESRYPIRPVYTGDTLALKNLEIQLPDSCVPALLNMRDMSAIRELIAAQNAYEVPDESWNPELLRAQKYLREQESGNGVKPDLEAAVYSVAVGTGRRAQEIWSWPIREFIRAQEAVTRKYNYNIYSTAELTGFMKFKSGNPYPSWLYDRETELPTGFMSVSELDAGHKGLLADKTQTI